MGIADHSHQTDGLSTSHWARVWLVGEDDRLIGLCHRATVYIDDLYSVLDDFKSVVVVKSFTTYEFHGT